MFKKKFIAVSGFTIAATTVAVCLVHAATPTQPGQADTLPLVLRLADRAGSAMGLGSTSSSHQLQDTTRLSPLNDDQLSFLIKKFGFERPDPSHGPVAVCLAPGSEMTEELQARLDMVQQNPFDDRYQINNRWDFSGTFGDPIVISWSLVPDGLSIPSGVGEPAAPSNLFAQWDARLPRASWIALIQSSLERWSEVSGTAYQRVTAANVDWDDGAAWGTDAGTTRGRVRIGMKPIDGAFNILAYNGYPQGGDMVLDSAEMTSSGFTRRQLNYLFFRNTVQHEHGHGLGFRHTCSSDSEILMEPSLQTTFDGVTQDDIRAAHRNYGDINEPDNTSGTAVSAGNIGPGTSRSLGDVLPPAVENGSSLSIDINGEIDWHSFNTDQILLADFALLPIGSTYDNSTQNANSTCNSGTPLNTLAVANLGLDLYNPSVALISTVNANPAGVAETMIGTLLSPAGTHYLRVFESNTPTSTQLYKISITNVVAPVVTATDNQNNQVSLSWTVVPGTTTYRVARSVTNNFASAAIIGTPATNAFVDSTAPVGVTQYYFISSNQGSVGTFRLVGSDSGLATVPAPACPADFNADGFVDDTDFVAFAAAYEAFVVPPADPAADLNTDGFVDDADFVVFAAAYETFVCP